MTLDEAKQLWLVFYRFGVSKRIRRKPEQSGDFYTLFFTVDPATNLLVVNMIHGDRKHTHTARFAHSDYNDWYVY